MPDHHQDFGPITRWLVRRFVEPPDRELSPAERGPAYGLLEGYISVVLNTVLFAIKLALGLVTGSIALIADGVHSLSDSVTSVVIIAGSYVARRPPDPEHPFGHGRAESVAALIVAVLLALAGFEFGKEAVLRILEPAVVDAPWWAIAVVVLTMPIKEWLCRFASALGRVAGNEALEADAWHHRSDVLSTGLVVGGVVAADFGLTWLDGVVGVGICLVLLKVAYDVGRQSFDSLVGRPPTSAEVTEVREKALAVEGVQGAHDIVIHHYGAHRFVSLHVETTDQLGAMELHALAHRVEHAVEGDLHGSVCVHTDPVDRDHPEYAAVEALVEAHLAAEPLVESFHDLRLVGAAEEFNLVVDYSVRGGGRSDWREVRERLAARVQEVYPAAGVVVEFDPLFARDR